MCKRNIIYSILLLGLSMVVACTDQQPAKDGNTSQAENDSLADKMYEAYDSNDFRKTIVIGQDLAKRYETAKDTASLCDVLTTLCAAYQRTGNIAEGLKMAMRAISLDSIAGDPGMLSGDYNLVAALYLSEDKVKEAESFIVKAIDYEKKTMKKEKLSIYYGIASEIYCKSEQPDKAIDYARRGLALAEQRKDTMQMSKRLSQLGQAYLCGRKLDDAERAMLRCVGILEQQEPSISLGITYRQLGNMYEEQNKQTEAIAYYEKALRVARKTNYMILVCKCTQDIGKLVASADPGRAIALLKESRALADTIHSHKVEELMADYATRFDLDEKRITIERQATELKIHRIILAVLVVVSVFVVVVISLMLYMKRQNRRHEQIEARMSERIIKQSQHQDEKINDADKDFLKRFDQFVEEHINDASLSSSTIADVFCLSQRQFSRKVKLLTGLDTSHYIQAKRMLKARHLLVDTDLPIQEIYMKCGFDNPSYFSRVFRLHVGVSPTDYRRNPTVSSEE